MPIGISSYKTVNVKEMMGILIFYQESQPLSLMIFAYKLPSRPMLMITSWEACSYKICKKTLNIINIWLMNNKGSILIILLNKLCIPNWGRLLGYLCKMLLNNRETVKLNMLQNKIQTLLSAKNSKIKQIILHHITNFIEERSYHLVECLKSLSFHSMAKKLSFKTQRNSKLTTNLQFRVKLIHSKLSKINVSKPCKHPEHW